MQRRHILRLAGVGAAGIAIPSIAPAQSFPSRTIRYICPWPAGGSTDVVMRAIAESAGKALGVSIIVDNKDLGDFAKANPDKFTYGHTGIGTSQHLAVEEFAQRAASSSPMCPSRATQTICRRFSASSTNTTSR